MDLAIRIDLKSDGDAASLVGLLDSLGGSYWVVREGGSANPHVHVHYVTTKSLNAVRLAFKKRFPNHIGNGGYSIKQCDADVTGYDRYMAKGDDEETMPIIIAQQGLTFTLDAIKVWHQEYWEVNHDLLKKRRKKLGNVTDELLQYCISKGINKRGDIGLAYLSLMKESNKAINIFAGKAAINTVWLHVCQDSEARNALLTELVGGYAEDALARL